MSNLFYDKEEQDSLLIPVEDEQYTVVTGTNEESVMTIDNSQQQDSILVPEATQSVIIMETGTTTPKPSVPVGNYVTLDTDQTITGNKDFAGNLTFHGVTVATLDDIDLSNLVDLTSQQTISGVKIFKDQIGILNSSDGDINLIKHINNNFLITENNGNYILDIDEQLKSMYLYNKKIATEEYVNEKAMEGGSGTVVNVGGVEVSTLNFTSDPQTQISNISENLPENVSDLTNDVGFITKSVDNLDNYYDKDYIDNNHYDKTEVDQRIPTALSHLTNDIGFIDNSVSDLLNYYTKLQTNDLLSGKVDKDGNKVLSTNDYTTAEKNKLASLSNYDDTDIKEDIADRYTKNETDALLLHKVDKTTLNDYYKSTDVDNLLSNKVDITTLTTNYYNKTQTNDLLDTKASTSSVTNAITESKGYTDIKISELIGGAPETLNTLKEIADAFAEDQEVLDALETAIGTKVDKVEGKGLSSNDYTDTEKTKLASLSNYDDTAIYAEVNKKANKSELDNYYKKTETYDVVEIDGLLNSKVDKVTGKGLSTNDYTTAEKNKLNDIEEGAEKNKVNSVNGKTGNIVLTATDVGALPNTTVIPKLYNSIGENTDGAIDQATMTTFLNNMDEVFVGFENGLNDRYIKPSTGIPKTDLASDVQTSLGKADTALQSIHKLSLGTSGGTSLVEFDGSEDKEFIVDLSGYLTEDDKNELNSSISGKAETSTVDALTNRVSENEEKISQLEGGGVTVVDNLESTSTTQALSANQGRVLNELVYDFSNGVNNSLIDLSARVTINKNDIVKKADNVNGATVDNFASLNADGNLQDSGIYKGLFGGCILEAPNGVLTYSGSTVTVKAGLRVLIPNGLNTNGTPKFIDYILPADDSWSVSYAGYVYALLQSNGNLIRANGFIGYHSVEPPIRSGLYGYYINTTTNKCYESATGVTTWTEVSAPFVVVGRIETSSNAVLRLYPENTGLPSKQQINSTTLIPNSITDVQNGDFTSSVTFTAQATGWLIVRSNTNVTANGFINIQNSTRRNLGKIENCINGNSQRVFVPVVRGDAITISISSGYSMHYYIIPSEVF